MKSIDRLIYKTDSKEELIPGYSDAFLYVSSRVELDKYFGRYVPWHWHKTIELNIKSTIIKQYNHEKWVKKEYESYKNSFF